MQKYVALLRGINVGGNNKIGMMDLVKCFTNLGFSDVKTYINSGNVIFSTETDHEKVNESIEKALKNTFGLKVKTIVKTKTEIEEAINHFPEIFQDKTWKHNIIFVSQTVDPRKLVERLKKREGIEENSAWDGVIYWSASLDAGTRPLMYKLSREPEYQEMSVRSIGTVKKILELM